MISRLSDTAILAEEKGALYVLKPVLPEEKPVYDRLLTISNGNIANVVGYAEREGRLYSVSEYIRGVTLEEYVTQRGTLSDAETRRITLDICSGLSAVHKLGIVHRDITPGNIIIEDSGKARITDFGISRVSVSSKSKDTQILGTVGYAAPEQFGFTQTTSKADIYAVGVLINYMVKGTLPNEQLTEGAFRKVVLRCTQMDETNRYRDIEEVAAAVSRKSRRALFVRSIPGFNGSKGLKAFAVYYYISAFSSSFVCLFMPGKQILFAIILILMLIPPFIVADSSGRIGRFCRRHSLSHGVEVFFKFLIILALLYFSVLLIIIDSL